MMLHRPVELARIFGICFRGWSNRAVRSPLMSARVGTRLSRLLAGGQRFLIAHLFSNSIRLLPGRESTRVTPVSDRYEGKTPIRRTATPKGLLGAHTYRTYVTSGKDG